MATMVTHVSMLCYTYIAYPVILNFMLPAYRSHSAENVGQRAIKVF